MAWTFTPRSDYLEVNGRTKVRARHRPNAAATAGPARNARDFLLAQGERRFKNLHRSCHERLPLLSCDRSESAAQPLGFKSENFSRRTLKQCATHPPVFSN